VNQIHASHHLEQLAGNVIDAADAGRRHVDLARVAICPVPIEMTPGIGLGYHAPIGRSVTDFMALL
jgi:hypothetical protein